MAVIYKHIRKDTNKIFYIGIGKSKYRLTSRRNRNKYWLNIVNKVGYDAKIINENITWKEAQRLECILISKYGRIDNGTGILVNMTDGGDGAKGTIGHWAGKSLSKEHKKQISISGKGRYIGPMTELHKKKIGKANSKPQAKIQCPHCDKIGGTAMNRWHFDNCKNKL